MRLINEDLPPAHEENPPREDGPDQNNGGMERVEREWKVAPILLPTRREEESLLVEWARGQGLTVLPQPPLLSNNYLN